MRRIGLVLLFCLCSITLSLKVAWGDSDIQSSASKAISFMPMVLMIDSGDVPLAAYQVKISAKQSGVKLVGIEGGAHKSFSDAPYYDPTALHQAGNATIILAAYSLDTHLPHGKCRVATLHLQVTGDAEITPEFNIELTVVSDHQQQPIAATAQLLRTK